LTLRYWLVKGAAEEGGTGQALSQTVCNKHDGFPPEKEAKTGPRKPRCPPENGVFSHPKPASFLIRD